MQQRNISAIEHKWTSMIVVVNSILHQLRKIGVESKADQSGEQLLVLC